MRICHSSFSLSILGCIVFFTPFVFLKDPLVIILNPGLERFWHVVYELLEALKDASLAFLFTECGNIILTCYGELIMNTEVFDKWFYDNVLWYRSCWMQS